MNTFKIPKSNFSPHPSGTFEGQIVAVEDKGQVETQFGLKPKVAIVIESGQTSRKLVIDLRSRCEGAGIEPVGVIVNKMDFFTTGYGAYMRAYRAYARTAEDMGDVDSPDVKGGVA